MRVHRTLMGVSVAVALAAPAIGPAGVGGAPPASAASHDAVPTADPLAPQFQGTRREPSDLTGMSLAIGHTDSDAFGDLVVGAPGERATNDWAPITTASDGLPNADGQTLVKRSNANGPNLDTKRITASAGALGWSVAVGDFDNDGFDDVASGAPHLGTGGSVVVAFGAASGVSTRRVVLTQGSTGTTGLGGDAEAGDLAGYALAVGDFDNNGKDDLAIGLPGEDVGATADAGSIAVKFGAVGGFASGVLRLEQTTTLAGDVEANDRVGEVLAAGDFNNDSRDDLAIGIPHEDSSTIVDSGAVEVKPGPLGGNFTNVITLQQATELGGDREAGDRVGSALAVGDFNHDNRDDLAVGVPGEDLAGFGADNGIVTVVPGTASGPVGGAAVKTLSQRSGEGLGGAAEKEDAVGASLAAGDVNGDGVDDLAVGAPGESVSVCVTVCPHNGAVTVVLGTSGSLFSNPRPSTLYRGSGLPGVVAAGEQLGTTLAIGDLDGNVDEDLAIGVPRTGTEGLPNTGEVLVKHGSSAGVTGAATLHRQPLDDVNPLSAFGRNTLATFPETTGGRGGGAKAIGSRPVAVVIINSKEGPYDEPFSSSDVRARWQDTLWGSNGNGDAFFKANSFGKMRLTNAGIYGPITTSQVCQVEGNANTLYEPDREALAKAFLTPVAGGQLPFDTYDTNHDGVLTHAELIVVFVRDCWGIAQGDWPGKTRAQVIALRGDRDDANVRYDFGCAAAPGTRKFCGAVIRTEELTDFDSMMHELGHITGGMSDFYGGTGNPNSCASSNGFNCEGLSLMGTSTINTDNDALAFDDKHSLHHDGATKLLYGWTNPRVVDLAHFRGSLQTTATDGSAESAESTRPVILYDSTRSSPTAEFFVVEARSHTSPYDGNTSGQGLVIFRVRPNEYRTFQMGGLALISPQSLGLGTDVAFSAPSDAFQLPWFDGTKTSAKVKVTTSATPWKTVTFSVQ